VLENLSLRTHRKAELNLRLSTSASSTQLHQFVEGLKMLVQRNTIETSNAYLLEIISGSYEVHAEYFTAPITIEEFNTLKQEINLAVIRLMEESKLELAIPFRTV
jgi:MscS family membrane protein